jgi:hypothetical protein
MNGAIGTPSVTMMVQIPMYLALSFLKNVSATTPLPMAEAGEMKNAEMALQRPIVEYEGLTAHPTLPTKLQIRDTRKMGRRPNRSERGRQIKGATPRMAIWRDSKYDALWIETSRSAAISAKTDWTAAAVKVPIMAWNEIMARFTSF